MGRLTGVLNSLLDYSPEENRDQEIFKISSDGAVISREVGSSKFAKRTLSHTRSQQWGVFEMSESLRYNTSVCLLVRLLRVWPISSAQVPDMLRPDPLWWQLINFSTSCRIYPQWERIALILSMHHRLISGVQSVLQSCPKRYQWFARSISRIFRDVKIGATGLFVPRNRPWIVMAHFREN